MANKRKLEVVIAGDSKGLERAFGRSAKASDTFGRKLTGGVGKGLGTVAKVGGVAAVAVGVGFAAAMKHGIKGAMDHQKVMAQTNTVLKSTKNAVNTSTKAIEDNASALEAKTGIDGDVIQSGMNLMATFGKVRNEVGKGNDIFDQANKTALDMSVAFGQSAKSSSIQLGKALQDPIKGVSALTKVGVSFNDQQKEQIKTLVESGDVLGAQKIILGEVNNQVGGSAEAYGKTLPGQIDRAKRAFDNLTEAVAGPLLPLVGDIAEGLLGVFQNPEVQAGLTSFAKNLTAGVQQVVDWFRANWPQIKTIILAVFGALKTYYTTIVIPLAKGIISALRTVVAFVRDNWPQIKATAEAVFGWIKTNIVPTVQAVARGVGAAVRGMTRFWREHGDDIKAILGPVFNTIKTVIVNALRIIKGVIEIGLALIRGDWGKAWSSFKTVVKLAIDSVVSVLTLAPRLMWAAAKIIGREIIEGVKAGLVAGKDAIINKLKEIIGGAFEAVKSFIQSNSPSKKAANEIGRPIARGIAVGIERDSAYVASSLTKTVRDAVYSARQNLGGLTGGLAGMLGTLYGANSADAKRLREIRKQQSSENRIRERARLDDAIAKAETDEDRKAAEQDLADWLLDDEATRLEESIAKQQESYEENIRNLTASFNDGLISAETFQAELEKLIGGQTGADLGYAFASEFKAQLAAITQQISALMGTPVGAGGPGVEDPRATAADELAAWQKERKDYLAGLKKKYQATDSRQGKVITPYEQYRINSAMDAWDQQHPKPAALAMGGILNRQVFTAGEAGPEAVIPLSSGRAQRMLAAAIDGAGGGGGGATIINVTVNGNEFSAREFADKLAPELRRRVTMARSA